MFVVLNWPISSNNKSVVLFTFTHLINGSTVLCVGLGGYAFMHHHPVCVCVCGVVHVGVCIQQRGTCHHCTVKAWE